MMILQRLKQETGYYHKQVEKSLNILDQGLTLTRYKGVLENFLGFYQPIEMRLSIFARGHILNGEIERRKKTGWLRQDLYVLGIAEEKLAELPICARLPTVETLYQVFGCMYVLEGATLGGQIIAKHIQRRLHLDEQRGCAFFYGYGTETRVMWKAFEELLVEQLSEEDGEDAVVGAACETFLLFYQWLAGEARV